MTFFIVLFIVLMQFLWRYIDDLVGKGLSFGTLAELFFYAALSMVPMALPLAILLASLMTFGNMGEKSELTAIKASGVPLIKAMAPLIVLVSAIAVGAFFFQNDVLPRAQVKMWTLLFSARQKSPELEIPEGAFYDQIPGYNLYVKDKDRETGLMKGVMIYDVHGGGSNATILTADSARLAFTKDMRYLYLHLWHGEQFENLREQATADRNVPFRRESFADKEILIPFDANFNKIDEGGMKSQYIGKNISELSHSLDSISMRIDSIGADSKRQFVRQLFPVLAVRPENTPVYKLPSEVQYQLGTPAGKKQSAPPLNLDSLLEKMSPSKQDKIFAQAESNMTMRGTEQEFRAIQMEDEKGRYRRHEIELIKKFTLSVACLIFLFIGAPLGAIIRKGGLGTPLVISVLLFLVYYIIDNTGYKLARDGHWVIWAGMWLSTFVLLPLGIFVTYKAMNDSSVFNADLYKEWLRRRLGLPESRQVSLKEVVITEVDVEKVNNLLSELESGCASWLHGHAQRPGYKQYWSGIWEPEPIDKIGAEVEETVNALSDSRSNRVIALLNEFPVIRSLWILRPVKSAGIRKALMWFAPLGLIFWLASLPYARRVYTDIMRTSVVVSRMRELMNTTEASDRE